MFDSFRDEGRHAFQIKWLFFANAKEYCRRSEILAVKDFVLRLSNIIFGSLGETGLNTAECLATTTFIPYTFSAVSRGNIKRIVSNKRRKCKKEDAPKCRPRVARSRLAPTNPALQQQQCPHNDRKMGNLCKSPAQITYMLDEALFNAVNVLAMPPVLVLEVVASSVSAMVVSMAIKL